MILLETFKDQMNEIELNHLSFVLFIFDGIGEFLGGLFMVGYSSKIQNHRKLFMVAAILFSISVGVIFLGSYLKN